jgi:Flp pilus assembly protein protease CpaA
MVDPAAVGWAQLLFGVGFGLTAASLLVSCWIDFRYRLVCDEACVAALAGSVLMMFGGHDIASTWYWLAVAAVAIVLFALFAMRALGGGDFKLMLALLPGLGLWSLALFVVWTSIAGGVVALVYRIATTTMRRRAKKLGGRTGVLPPKRLVNTSLLKWLRHESARIRRGKSIPYVPAIAAGWLIAQLA